MSDVRPQIDRTAIAVTLLSVSVSSGCSMVGLVRPTLILPPGALPDASTTIFAAYALARSIALTIAVLITIFLQRLEAFHTLGFLAGGI